MGFSIDRRAHRPGGWFRRAPDPREVGERLTRLVKRLERDRVVRIASAPFAAELALHPAATPIRIVLDREGLLSVRGDTGMVGPGYHADVVARVARILDEIDYVWTEPEPDPQVAMCAWLASELAADGQIRIGVPPERSFITDAPVLTALGPRDAIWRERVRANPRDGADAFAWWQPGAPGHAARSRALLAMWLEVPWRRPIYPDERARLEDVDAQLRAARAASPELELPYPEWAELLGYLEQDDEHAATIRARARGLPSQIGYRRLDMEVELSGGWSMHLPGSFTGLWIDDGARYWASDGDRVVEFTSLTAAGETDSERLLAGAVAQHPVIERFVDGARRGRADAHDENDLHVVHGLVAIAPDVAILTFKISPADRPWALATWRSVRR